MDNLNTAEQYLGIIVLVGVVVGSLWYWIVQRPRNIRERNRETLRKFMEREDRELRDALRDAGLRQISTSTYGTDSVTCYPRETRQEPPLMGRKERR